MSQLFSIYDFLPKIVAGNRRALAKAITLIEGRLPQQKEQAQKLLEQALPHSGKSIRLGITGIPGVGKSSLIEVFGLYLIEQGHKVAVLAVDPSSSRTGGSILGDKTRMTQLSQNQNAFIRPTPSSGTLGGVAQKTREVMLLCEAAGYDIILVETVGVGQSEIEVASMVDFFMVLLLPNSGDELQGIKKGILELADLMAINKADGDNLIFSQIAKKQIQNALGLIRPRNDFWRPECVTCSAQEKINIHLLWERILEFKKRAQSGDDCWSTNRSQQNKQWMWKLIQEQLYYELQKNEKVQEVLTQQESEVILDKTTPQKAAEKVLGIFLPSSFSSN